MVTMQHKILSFDSQKELYLCDPYFGSIWKERNELGTNSSASYVIQDGLLFKGSKLFNCEGLLRELII